MGEKKGKPEKSDREMAQLRSQIESLRAELEEAKETLTAIQNGAVDALVINSPEGQRVFSLQGAERPYRALIEQMQEGAAMLAADGTVHYCNLAFASMLNRPMETVVGSRIEQHIDDPDRQKFQSLLLAGRACSAMGEVSLHPLEGRTVPVHLGMTLVVEDAEGSVCMVVTDQTERKRHEARILQLNEELEQRVTQRTAELQAANLELAGEVAERNRQAAAAEQQRQLLAVTLASIGDAVIVTDAQGRVSFLNAEAERLTAWRGAEAHGQPLPAVFKIVNEETRQPVENPVDKVLRLGTVVGLANHTVLIAKDGRETPIDDSAALIRDRDGAARGVVLVFRDFSEQKAAEKALRESEERFRTMADAMPQLAWTAHADGYIHWYNRRWYEYTGTTPQKMEGWGWQSVHDPIALPQVMERWKASLATGEPFEMEFPLRGADGRFRRFLTRGMPLKDGEGHVVQWFGTNTDVEELARTQESLRDSEERFRALAENVPDLITRFDRNLRLLYANPAVYRRTGLSPEALVGRTAREYGAAPAATEQWERVAREVLSLGEPRRIEATSEWQGQTRVYDTQLIPERDADGTVRAVIACARDITERKRAEEALRESEAELSFGLELNDALRQLDDPIQIQATAARLLGERLEADRVFFSEIVVEDGIEITVIERDYHRPGVSPITGRFPFREFSNNDYEDYRAGRTVYSPNVFTDGREPSQSEAYRAADVAAYIGVPLVKQGKLLSVLGVVQRQPRNWIPEEIRLAEQAADRIWHTIQRARAEARLETDLAALTRMHALSGRSGELQPLLQEIMDAAVAIMGAHRGTLQLLDGDSLRIVAHHGHEQPFLEFFAAAENRASVCGEATRRGERVLVSDVEKSPLFAGTPSLAVLRQAGVRAVQSTPMVSRAGALLGILTTQWSLPYSPDEHDLWRLDLLVRQAADMVERSQAEEALRESEERFRALVTASSDVVYRMSPDWSEMRQLRGRGFLADTEEPKRDWLEPYIPPEDRSQVMAVVNGAIATKSVFELEHRVLRADGSVGWTFSRAVPLLDAKGEIVEWFGAASDITARKQAEEGLQAARVSAEHAKAAAETANKAKDHFLAVLSHELRTPLAPVIAALAMLQENPRFDADTRDNLEMIRRNVELEARLIDDLLDVTRIERGKVELDKQPVELCTILHRAAEVCKPDIEARKLEFGIDLPDRPYVVEADVARLQQVFWNLLKNAIKFTPTGGCVGIRCRRIDDHVIAEVNDSGQGIDPHILPRLFDAFEQGDRQITRQFGGLGLGLAISKAITEMHGGTLTAHSQGRGRGATFTVKLPVLPAGTAVSKTRLRSESLMPGALTRPLRILLVEDHGDTARIMQRLLSADGHEVQLAADVATALKLAGEQPFDLLLSDLGLPDGSGLDLMRGLRGRGITVPGIALSGYGQDQDVQQSREAGFAAHLVKPVSLPKLEEAIAKAVGHGARAVDGGEKRM